ncbi:unnamed protein product, partial [Rotaria magnacalcarata]
IKSGQTSTATSAVANSDIIIPLTIETNFNKNINSKETKETTKPIENHNIDYERLAKIKDLRARYTFRIRTHSLDKFNDISIKQSLSSDIPVNIIQRKKYLDLKLDVPDKKRNIRKTSIIIPTFTQGDKKENAIIIEEDEREQQNFPTVPTSNIELNENGKSATLCAVH